MSSNNGRTMISPIIDTIKPVIIDNTSAVCMAWLALSSLYAPKKREIITLAPTEKPTKIVINRLVIGAVLPTAASEWLPENCPTVATSQELNNCWIILVAAKGNANNRILLIAIHIE